MRKKEEGEREGGRREKGGGRERLLEGEGRGGGGGKRERERERERERDGHSSFIILYRSESMSA